MREYLMALMVSVRLMSTGEMMTNDELIISRVVMIGSGGLALVGLVLNLVLVRVLWRIGELWGSFTYRLVTWVAVGDGIVSLTILGGSVFREILGYSGVVRSGWYCRVFGFGLLFGHNLSGLVISVIALDRYLVVRHSTRLRPLHICFVVGGIMVSYGTVLGINSYQNAFRMDLTKSFCLPHGKPISTVAEWFSTLLFNLPLFVLSFCYITIFFVCRRIQRSNKKLLEGHRPARALVWISAYLVCYSPKLVGTIWYISSNAFPALPFCIITALGLNSIVAINPILVLFLNKQVHKEVASMYFPQPNEISAHI
ncbi:G-protein coupled receptor 35 [Entomophthora muscae]|uniref:G-protein coupled receptor 35 n=1 Tax=Entomophthora muscae TaxID=34485 RepID=A0ACC2SM63_9FUNG|nr:G-protein coupled receptor 35 [Entomophthora muscae]